MFAKTIIDSDAFLDMPLSTQALYFHLAMRADDDGFLNNAKKIQREVGANQNDYDLLVSKRFILQFDDGICVIKHWRIHNYIRNDRYKETIYQEQKKLLGVKDNKAYTFSNSLNELPFYDGPYEENKHGIPNDIPNDTQMETQVRLGKDRLGKDSIDKRVDYQQIADMYNNTCVSFPNLKTLSEARKKAIKARLKTYSVEDIEKAFILAEQSDFLKGKNDRNWSANFDWILKDSNMAKILDGNYDSKKGGRVNEQVGRVSEQPGGIEDLTPEQRKAFGIE